jgi:hypothetical protein
LKCEREGPVGRLTPDRSRLRWHQFDAPLPYEAGGGMRRGQLTDELAAVEEREMFGAGIAKGPEIVYLPLSIGRVDEFGADRVRNCAQGERSPAAEKSGVLQFILRGRFGRGPPGWGSRNCIIAD